MVGATNPGLKIRLSQSGLNYAARVAVQKMSAKVQRAPLPDHSGGGDTPVGYVSYEVKNMRVSSAYSCISGAAAGHMWGLCAKNIENPAFVCMKLSKLPFNYCGNFLALAHSALSRFRTVLDVYCG